MAVLLSDSFNRANSTTTLGTTDSYNGGTAKTYTYDGTPWGISSNQAAPQATYTSALLPMTTQDIVVKVDMPVLGDSRIFAKYTAYNNLLRLQVTGTTYYIAQTLAGTDTTLGSFGGAAAGDHIELTCQGTTLTVKVNSVQKWTGTFDTSLNVTNNNVGLYNHGSTTVRFDNFEVDSITSGKHNKERKRSN